MIRRTFFQLFSGLLLPRPAPETAVSPEPDLRGMMRPPVTPSPDPEWLREWRQIPRLEVCSEDLPFHNDPHQRALAADILLCIHSGTPFTFRYLGGSGPGEIRSVFPTWLFFLDYFSHYQYLVDDPGEIPEAADCPIYLLAWCQSRSAPRTFRLDRIEPQPQNHDPCHLKT